MIVLLKKKSAFFLRPVLAGIGEEASIAFPVHRDVDPFPFIAVGYLPGMAGAVHVFSYEDNAGFEDKGIAVGDGKLEPAFQRYHKLPPRGGVGNMFQLTGSCLAKEIVRIDFVPGWDLTGFKGTICFIGIE